MKICSHFKALCHDFRQRLSQFLDHVKTEVPPEVGQELEVTTTPVSGEIFIDGVSKGWGSVAVTLSTGSHTVSFGAVSGYTTPAALTVNVVD